jgi:SAM-dependent methyltransferase
VTRADPPLKLLARSTGSLDAEEFWRVGADIEKTLMSAVAASSLRPVSDILDWGCGTGRVAWHLAQRSDINLTGCDLDAEAVDWCNANIKAGAFSHNGSAPPLPYDAESFDAVLGVSVMTHLQRRWQLAWLTEIRRVLRPGGVAVLSVHGRTAASQVEFLADHVENVGGIYDTMPTVSHDGLVPAGYYRDVYQTETYTRDRWSGRLPVVAYQEAGVNGHQDLVVCRKS